MRAIDAPSVASYGRFYHLLQGGGVDGVLARMVAISWSARSGSRGSVMGAELAIASQLCTRIATNNRQHCLLPSQRDVLGHREVGQEAQLLVNDPDTQVQAAAGFGRWERLPPPAPTFPRRYAAWARFPSGWLLS